MNIESTGFFKISKNEIFDKITRDFKRFIQSNSVLDLLDLVLWLRHLSEWIELESDYGKEFIKTLNEKDSFKTLIGLSNRGKHHTLNRGKNVETTIAEGGQVGLMQAGDMVGQDHFIVNGQDIRLALNEVYNEYEDYFNKIKFET